VSRTGVRHLAYWPMVELMLYVGSPRTGAAAFAFTALLIVTLGAAAVVEVLVVAAASNGNGEKPCRCGNPSKTALANLRCFFLSA